MHLAVDHLSPREYLVGAFREQEQEFEAVPEDAEFHLKRVADQFQVGRGSQDHLSGQPELPEVRSLSISALARELEMSDPHLGRIERGLRQPTRKLAIKLDQRFPGREGAFLELYEASRSWVPPAFRIWAEHEDITMTLFVWSPYTIDGLLQTEDYARALLETAGFLAETVIARLKDRMDRQRRILYRDDPPRCIFVVDLLSLYREVGSPALMAAQLDRLAEVAQLPHVTMVVMPAVAHPCNESGFIIADDAVFAESAAVGGVHQDQSLETLSRRFDVLRGESYRASESLGIIRRLADVWRRGESPLTQA